MTNVVVKYRDWVFEVDKMLTEQTYEQVPDSGADGCTCEDCRNYVAFRDKVFPNEILKLFVDLGIDYRKEVEITSFEKTTDGLTSIGGWFHFKGRIINGKDCRINLLGGGFTLKLTKITDDFEIGFAKGSSSTFFDDKEGLVQIEFETEIPWIIDRAIN